MCKPSLLKPFSLLGLTIVVGLSSGCSSIDFLNSNKLPAEAVDNSDLYRVEMHFNRGEPKVFDGHLNQAPPNYPVTVQTALELSGAIEKYKRMNITVYRRVAETGRGLKLPVTFQPRSNMVKVEQDYALHPGDRIVITPVSSGLFSVVFDGMSEKNVR